MNKFPENWDDETKYPNKRLEYLKSPEDCKMLLILLSDEPPHNKNDENDFIYYGMIHESWVYDNPNNKVTGKSVFFIRRCTVCGSYNISESHYNTLCPKAMVGSTGIMYTCDDCGHFYMEYHIAM